MEGEGGGVKHTGFMTLPCQPMEYGNEHSNRLSYLVRSLFMMSAKPFSTGRGLGERGTARGYL